MMLMNDRLKVTLQTIHIPLKRIAKEVTEKNYRNCVHNK